jgi:ferric-dicitrate binding protein FerR (iron transport regulator)
MTPETEMADRLRDSLGAVANRVQPSPDAYERALTQWRRRERRRRLAAVLLAVLLIAGADGVGLWALNRSAPTGPVVFDGPAPAGAP